MKSTGILLVNLGTPESPKVSSVKKYLKEFLMDKRVITLPYLIRSILVKGLIVPFRSRKTAKNYQAIWTEEGSPLMLHTQQLATKLKEQLPSHCQVAYGMRYGQPSIENALLELKNLEKIIVLPLYPQYASATTGSSIEKIFEVLSTKQVLPEMHIIRDFFNHPDYLDALIKTIGAQYKKDHHLILSYHGLPEHQLEAIGCKPICEGSCSFDMIKVQGCYRQQCFIGAYELTKTLKINHEHYTVSFQSRLGKTPWIKPYTDETLHFLAQKGIKKLQIACPSFVADCLETLEEISIGIQEEWYKLGGESFEYIPCLNSSDIWVEAVKKIVLER
jgi:ferrochelatase